MFVARLVDLGHILYFFSPHSCDPFPVLTNELMSLQHGGNQSKLVRMCIVLLFYLWFVWVVLVGLCSVVLFVFFFLF